MAGQVVIVVVAVFVVILVLRRLSTVALHNCGVNLNINFRKGLPFVRRARRKPRTCLPSALVKANDEMMEM